MNNKGKTLILFILFGIIAVLTGTYAFYIWNSPEDTNTAISFTTSSDFSCSAKGSNLVSSNNVTLIPTNCNNQEHVIKKKIVTNLNNTIGSTYLSLWLDVNSIGSYLANSDNFKYALTTSEASCDTGLVYMGSFKDLQAGDKSNLMISQEFSTGGSQTYYLWLWLDEAEVEIPPEDIASRSFDLSLNGECSDEGPTTAFEITSLNSNYQILKATAVNFRNDIVGYAITNTEIEPVNNISDNVLASPLINRNTNKLATLLADNTSWIDIPIDEQGNIYNLEYVVNNTGTYYVWFRDRSGDVISKPITVSTIDTTGPVCTWGNFDVNNIKNGDNASVTLTCIDPEVGISSGDISTSDIVVDNNNVTINNITNEKINNGYKYTIKLTGTSVDGSTGLSLKNNIIKNKADIGNDINSSSLINVTNKNVFDGYTITLSDNTYTYDGLEKKPSVTISKDGVVLTEGTDYTLRYANNINAGVATVVISGKGSFSGNINKTFTINKAECVCTINSIPTLKYIDEISGDITYSCTGDGSLTVTSSKTNIISIGNVLEKNATLLSSGIGTSKIIVKRFSGNNYNSCTAYKDISVAGDSYTITYKDVDNKEFSGIHEEGYPETYTAGIETLLDIPTKKGYSFAGYYKTYNTIDNTITKLKDESENLVLYAKWIDDPPYGTASLSLSGGKFNLTLSNYGDDGSGITDTYGFALTTSDNCSSATYEDQASLTKEYSGSYTANSTYYGCIRLTDKSGSIAYIKSAGVKYSYTNVSQSYTTSGSYTYTVPETGNYKLEVWGAQGGKVSTTVPGYGSYSVGRVNLTKGDILYIVNGGAGSEASSSSTFTSGGYNGGGQANYGAGTGGGATHIATVSGLLSTLSSQTNNILIVAGGGGGTGTYNSNEIGGSGGGMSGVTGGHNSSDFPGGGAGGSQTAGGSPGSGSTAGTTGQFGQGGNGGYESSYSQGSGAGGGGYYGGGGGSARNGGGGGGSGYIGNSLLTDKYMYCYNCTESSDINTMTYTTTNVSDTPTSDYAKSGDGATKITAIVSQNVDSLVLTYNNNGGSGCYTKSIVNGENYGELCTPYKDGYSFNGWYTDASGGTEVTSSTKVTVTANQTIYARWTENAKPIISFSPDGNSSYTNGNVNSTIKVSKGNNRLDASTFKYTWSTDKNATPDESFMTGNSYTLEDATGIYYLIARACDVNGECVTEVSKPFYVDNEAPTGSVILSQYDFSIVANVDAVDSHSGINNYGYLLTTDSTCPSTGYVSSSNVQYSFKVQTSGTYRVCVKVIDKVGNVNIISNTIKATVDGITYSMLALNYKCANNEVGTNPYITYTGNCEIVDDGDGNWKVRFLTSGDLVFNSKVVIDTFLVGGGSGGSNLSGSNAWGGGGGGYTLTKRNKPIEVGTVYPIVVGAGGAVTAAGESSSAFGFTAAGGTAGNDDEGHNGGSGGGGGRGSGGSNGSDGNITTDSSGTVYGAGRGQINLPGPNGETGNTREFGEETGQLYAGGGGGAWGLAGGEGGGGAALGGGYTGGSDGVANTGGGGGASHAGGSGIVIIRNAREGVALNFNYKCDNAYYGSYNYYLTYTGDCEIVNEGNDNWKIKFLSNGTLKLTDDTLIDAFLVGGGGGGGTGCYYYACGSGGGGGYTLTKKKVNLTKNTEYQITIGAGGISLNDGESTTAFGFIAAGGIKGTSAGTAKPGNGGSGGGGSTQAGASDGADAGGKGQISTPGPNGETGSTREFGEPTGDLYSGGGGGAGYYHPTTGNSVPGGDGGAGGGGAGVIVYESSDSDGYNGIPNTGGGGGGSGMSAGGTGGSGIVIIRNAR